MNELRKSRRGFASMSPEQQREIASKGGRRAHELKVAHQWDTDEAREAGRKGGKASRGGRGKLPVTPVAVPTTPAPAAAGEPAA